MRLIDAEELFEKAAEWEAHALEHVGKLNEQEGDETPSLEWRKWTAILGERSAFKHDIMDAPTVDAVPVVRCKDCIHCSKYDCWTENGVVTLNSCWNDKGIFTYVLDNDYCSRGYRRDNNEIE